MCRARSVAQRALRTRFSGAGSVFRLDPAPLDARRRNAVGFRGSGRRGPMLRQDGELVATMRPRSIRRSSAMVPGGGWNPQPVLLRIRMRRPRNRARFIALAPRIAEHGRSADQADALGRPPASRPRPTLVAQTL